MPARATDRVSPDTAADALTQQRQMFDTAHDFLTTQSEIFQRAPDEATAVRWQLAAALLQIGVLTQRTAALEGQLREATAGAPRRPTPSLRPAILTLLRERGPLTRAQIEEAMEAGTRLADPLRGMVQDGRLTLVDGQYGLADAQAAVPPPPALEPASRKRGGRTRSQG